LTHLIERGQWQQVLVFTRTKHAANRLTQQLQAGGISAAAIHGNKSQNARTRALSEFRENRIIALIATEVAARGLDIRELPHVVNFELPHVPEDYVHRIGRTARAGNSGAAISLVSPDEAPLLRDIEKLLGHPLPTAPLPDYPLPAAPSGVIAGQSPRTAVATPSHRSAHRHDSRRSPGRHAGRPSRARPHHGHGQAASETAGNPRARRPRRGL
jgi:ATP-dependent RNA helicase RhlE